MSVPGGVPFLSLLSRGAEELKPGQLELLPVTGQVKVRLARRLRRETTMSLKWIAEQLGIGSWKYLSNLLSERRTNAHQAGFGLWPR